LQLVLDFTLGSGVAAQAKAFRDGFNTIFKIENLRCFELEELCQMFGNPTEDWSYHGKLVRWMIYRGEN
jgi:E3 ubiquitin-protein ligase TRIP12